MHGVNSKNEVISVPVSQLCFLLITTFVTSIGGGGGGGWRGFH